MLGSLDESLKTSSVKTHYWLPGQFVPETIFISLATMMIFILYLTIIPQAHIGYEMVDNQLGA